ncbi:hypothetical protein K402DRAFT_423347 [Aulographum hederae CBS 113979]|uniref:Uncharacterized protein n=1 Tax=Aulographum hederae CBS 113979 TaxID=1176131 RepID=A0A6G1GTE9_9PEZI|nr:hypothetical protein K402DRAFT_423347 [Aulographum hederae CBS 113979]
MGNSISAPLIVFLAILGAAAAVCVGYAIHRLLGFGGQPEKGDNFLARSQYQEEYMREVRLNNMKELSRIARSARRPNHPRQPSNLYGSNGYVESGLSFEYT